MVWELSDPITIATAAGIGAACQSVAWRLSQSRGSLHLRPMVGAGCVNGLVCAAGSLIATKWLPESPLLVIGGAWILAWAIDFSRADTRERWASLLYELAEIYLRSKRDRKDDRP